MEYIYIYIYNGNGVYRKIEYIIEKIEYIYNGNGNGNGNGVYNY